MLVKRTSDDDEYDMLIGVHHGTKYIATERNQDIFLLDNVQGRDDFVALSV